MTTSLYSVLPAQWNYFLGLPVLRRNSLSGRKIVRLIYELPAPHFLLTIYLLSPLISPAILSCSMFVFLRPVVLAFVVRVLVGIPLLCRRVQVHCNVISRNRWRGGAHLHSGSGEADIFTAVVYWRSCGSAERGGLFAHFLPQLEVRGKFPKKRGRGMHISVRV